VTGVALPALRTLAGERISEINTLAAVGAREKVALTVPWKKTKSYSSNFFLHFIRDSNLPVFFVQLQTDWNQDQGQPVYL